MIMLIPTEASLTTGNVHLDLEHKQIFETLKQLEDPLVSQVTRLKNCDHLIKYISSHCREEEKMMEIYGVSNLEKHTQAHKVLADLFISKLVSYIKQGSVPGKEIKKAFYSHIMIYDLPMVEAINNIQRKGLE